MRRHEDDRQRLHRVVVMVDEGEAARAIPPRDANTGHERDTIPRPCSSSGIMIHHGVPHPCRASALRSIQLSGCVTGSSTTLRLSRMSRKPFSRPRVRSRACGNGRAGAVQRVHRGKRQFPERGRCILRLRLAASAGHRGRAWTSVRRLAAASDSHQSRSPENVSNSHCESRSWRQSATTAMERKCRGRCRPGPVRRYASGGVAYCSEADRFRARRRQPGRPDLRHLHHEVDRRLVGVALFSSIQASNPFITLTSKVMFCQQRATSDGAPGNRLVTGVSAPGAGGKSDTPGLSCLRIAVAGMHLLVDRRPAIRPSSCRSGRARWSDAQ
jgi:hypothetical protein